MAAQPQAFTLKVPEQAIADLHERLGRTRFPDQARGEPWAYGTDVGYRKQLVEYWRSAFDCISGRLSASFERNRRASAMICSQRYRPSVIVMRN